MTTETITGWRQQLHALEQYDGPADFDDMERYAAKLAASVGMLPDLYAGNPANVFTAMMQAKRLRISVMTAIEDLYYDGGQVAMRASLIELLILRAGHKIIHHRTDKLAARLEIVRCDGRSGGEVEWTIGEAMEAGLTGHPLWQDYPADCLFARCMARLARRHAADATGGVVYVPEELRSGYADGGELDVPLADRVVSEPVAALLEGLDEANHKQVRERWQTALDRGLVDAYAADGAGGAPVTLGAVLRMALERTMPKPRARSEPVAGGEALTCGCPVDEVIATGSHREGCDKRSAPAPAPAGEVGEPGPAHAVRVKGQPQRRSRRSRRGRR